MIPTESYKGVTRSGSKPPGGGPIQNSAGDPQQIFLKGG